MNLGGEEHLETEPAAKRVRVEGGASFSEAMSETGIPTMDDLIGPMDHLDCESGTLQVRGLSVTYWRYSNSDYADFSRPPVVALHGGPAFTHNYIAPLKLLAHKGFPVIFYDQAGCGASTFVENPAEDAPWLLTIPYYVEELAALQNHLKLSDAGFYVYGSSWGTCLAQEFAVTNPQGLRGLILDGALCDGQTYIKTQWRDRLSTMPSLTQKWLKECEEGKLHDLKAYKKLEEVLTHHFTTRLVPQPECWHACFKGVNEKICEFFVVGCLNSDLNPSPI